MYFEKCQDLNELKATYKRLALQHHPDMGGDVRVMQEINTEYDRVFLLLKAKQNTMANDDETGRTRKTTETPEEFRAVVEALLRLEGIEVELCGAWLWISGIWPRQHYREEPTRRRAATLWQREFAQAEACAMEND